MGLRYPLGRLVKQAAKNPFLSAKPIQAREAKAPGGGVLGAAGKADDAATDHGS